MKRSEINRHIQSAIDFFSERQFYLPPWAFWKPEDWKGKYESCGEIIDHQLGWDITDFGTEDFYNFGLILFTIRNGIINKPEKTFCEKIMIVEEGQVTPMHFHWAKTEDIINRGGGNLAMELYLADKSEKLTDKDFTVSTDGTVRHFHPGDKLILEPGESVTFPPYLAHRFYCEKGKVLVGEVSSVNDDNTDNCFVDGVGRFPSINEDEPPIHLLVSDYQNYL